MNTFKKIATSVAALGALALAGTAAKAANIGTVMKWNAVNIQGPILEGDAMSFVDTLVKLDPRKTITNRESEVRHCSQ